MDDQLPGAILQSVLAKTDASDCARAGCVSRRWSQIHSDDNLWRTFCLRDFAVSTKLDPLGFPCASFKETYKSWQTIFEDYPKPLVMRAKRCWDQIKDWLRINFVEVLDSLVPGASLDEIKAAEKELGFELPAPVRLLYQLCNGQELPFDDEYDDENDAHYINHVGLLGGYYFYQHYVNVRLLPLDQLVELTLVVRDSQPKQNGNVSRRVVIAASCHSLKVFFLDCDDGQVYVGTQNLQLNGEMMPCTPNVRGGAEPKDGMLRWLERYNHCLQTGMYNVRVEKRIRSISLFPLTAPLCSEAITKRIQIRTSAVFVPEESTTEERSDDRYFFTYSVSMRLLSPTSKTGESLLEKAQLLMRHWLIEPDGFPPTEVRGEAVIGVYPILRAGRDEFVYQSCTGLKSKTGTIEGDFTFVPGLMMKPTGASFTAYVARFPLEVPEYIF
ncbi:unnamed protein product [Calypogeia fissa]